MDSNTVIFGKICDLACELEDTHIHPRVKARLANAFDRAIGKALCISWDAKSVTDDNIYIQLTIFRHAERGVRDFVP